MDDTAWQWKTTVRLMKHGKAFGPGVAELLEGIEADGSLQAASRRMQMSYTKAWTIIRNAEAIWGFPLTKRYAGGKHGGHSVLTAQAVIVLRRFRQVEAAVRETAEAKCSTYFNDQEIDRLRHMAADRQEE